MGARDEARSDRDANALIRVSVVVPVHGAGSMLERCLEAIDEHRPEGCEVIVVCDGDPAAAETARARADVQVVELDEQGGPAHARNAGARVARGSILLFVDADTTVHAGTIARTLAILDDDVDLAAVFGSYDDEPAATGFFSQYKNLLHHYVHQTSSPDASTFFGACGAVRRQVFETLDGFDESFLWLEDVEFGHRLRLAGHTIRLDRDLQVTHHKRWTFATMLRSDIFHRAVPWTTLIHRDRFLIDDLNLTWRNRVSVGVAYWLLAALVIAMTWSLQVGVVSAGFAAIVLLIMNAPLYRFFVRCRGVWFTLRAIPVHWLYFVYAGATFAVMSVFLGLRTRRALAAGPIEAGST